MPLLQLLVRQLLLPPARPTEGPLVHTQGRHLAHPLVHSPVHPLPHQLPHPPTRELQRPSLPPLERPLACLEAHSLV